MNTFSYARPQTLEEVWALLSEYGSDAVLLAGGTDLMVRLRMRRITPRLVIDLKQIQALSSNIVEVDSCLRIGSLAVITDIIADARVRQNFPALVEAATSVGSVQIRNRATLAGNICNASPAADTAPALLVYGGYANLVGPRGRRRVPVDRFFTGPGKTVLEHTELVESIDLPLPQSRLGASFARLTRRRGVDLASVNLCCLVKSSGETRMAFGAVAPRPILAIDESGVLANPLGAPREREERLRDLISQTSPISDVRASREYRIAMLTVMSRRALAAALERLACSEQGEQIHAS